MDDRTKYIVLILVIGVLAIALMDFMAVDSDVIDSNKITGTAAGEKSVQGRVTFKVLEKPENVYVVR